MAHTRGSQDSGKSQPAKIADLKRAATDPSSEPRKRGRPSNASKKEQKTIEETLNNGESYVEDDQAIAEQINGKAEPEEQSEEKPEEKLENIDAKKGDNEEHKESEDIAKDESTITNGLKDGEKNAFDEIKGDVNEVKQEQDEKTNQIAQHNESIVTDEKREAGIPSSILEKGIIYFFFRSRVGVNDPHGIEDVARSYLVLRPLPLGAKLGEGPLEDSGNARLLALPKKMLPKSKTDRFLMFVEKTGQFIKDLREQFASNEYATKTSGTSVTPAATPFAEGIYAITSTGRESHLAYHITVPEQIGEVQKELGVHEKGSFGEKLRRFMLELGIVTDNF